MFFKKYDDNKRIHQLFKLYASLIKAGVTEEEAKIQLAGTTLMDNGRQLETYFTNDLIENKKIIYTYFPLEVYRYDVNKLVSFIIKWKNKKYWKKPNIKDVRAGKDIASALDKNISIISKQYSQ